MSLDGLINNNSITRKAELGTDLRSVTLMSQDIHQIQNTITTARRTVLVELLRIHGLLIPMPLLVPPAEVSSET